MTETNPDRHPKWQRVEPGTVIPAGQPYRQEGAWEDVTPKDYRIETGTSYEWFVDSSWKPPLVLPTTPGSVIEATDVAGTEPKLWMRGEFFWQNGPVDASDGDLTVVRVLFDAGVTP